MFEKLNNLFFKLCKKVFLNKISIFKTAMFISALIFISVVFEYFVFGYILKKTNGEVVIIENSSIIAENFELNNNVFVSQSEKSFLTLLTKKKYIDKLEIKFAENSNKPIIVRYVNPKNGQEVILQKNLQKNMEKNQLNFLNYSVFSVKNNPEKIILQVTSPQTKISKIIIDNSYNFNFYRFLFVFLSGFLFFFFVFFWKKSGKNPEYFFLTIALICGTLISVSETKSYVSWDEFIHYKRADNLSLKNIIKKDVVDIYSRTNSVPHSYSIKEQSDINNFFNNNLKKEVKKKKKDRSFSIIKFYNQLAYLPSSMALMLGRIIDLPNHLIFTFGRWINVLLFSLVVFFAIRKLKTGKMIMSVVALFPTVIFLSSNYGYDSWVIAFTMLGLAYLFSEIQQPDKKIKTKKIVIIISAFVIGLAPKAIYFPLMFLLFLLKPAKFNSLNNYKKFIFVSATAILLVVGSFAFPFIVYGPGEGDSRGGAEVNSTKQVEFILSEPLIYTKILLNFIKNYINPVNANGFMTSFAYLGMISGFSVLMTLLVIVLLTDKNEYDKETSNFKTKFWVVSVCFATIVLISTALYISFTPVGKSTIAGVQQRYLVPLVFPLVFVLGSNKIKNPINKNIYNAFIFIVITIILLWGVWDLIVKNYY